VRGRRCRRRPRLVFLLGGLLAAGTLLSGRLSGATPPIAVSVWLDRAGVEAAAASFDPEARRWFGRVLAGLVATDRCSGKPPGPPFACVDEGALLTRALPVLACPAVRAGRADRVEAFFETLGRRRLVRGDVSFVGPSTVTYRLVRPAGGWAISEVHRAVSPQPVAEGREVLAHLGCHGRLDLTGARLTGLDLRGEDLSELILQGADLGGADLTGARLHGADLRGANLEGARGLTRAQLESATIDGTTRLPTSLDNR
jgi:hypothetical protein